MMLFGALTAHLLVRRLDALDALAIAILVALVLVQLLHLLRHVLLHISAIYQYPRRPLNLPYPLHQQPNLYTRMMTIMTI